MLIRVVDRDFCLTPTHGFGVPHLYACDLMVHKPLSTHVASIILTTPVSASKMPQDNSHSLAHRGTTSSSTETPALASRGEKHGATGSLYPVLAIEDIYLAAGAALQDRLVDFGSVTFDFCLMPATICGTKGQSQDDHIVETA
jgi:hypothetical protein